MAGPTSVPSPMDATYVEPSAQEDLAPGVKGFATVSREATDALKPKYGRLYGYEEATLLNAEMVAWAMYEYR
ncbi:hypothetical protein [Streptomyces sp. bgisy022]|uniref:hypothetical protein n=1 Tax=Streptomyces sp. bgisy022 TaxID=3413769 RepID=UPI003D70F7FB